MFFFVLFVFAQYYSVCLFNSVLLCKGMSTQSALNNGADILTLNVSPTYPPADSTHTGKPPHKWPVPP